MSIGVVAGWLFRILLAACFFYSHHSDNTRRLRLATCSSLPITPQSAGPMCSGNASCASVFPGVFLVVLLAVGWELRSDAWLRTRIAPAAGGRSRPVRSPAWPPFLPGWDHTILARTRPPVGT